MQIATKVKNVYAAPAFCSIIGKVYVTIKLKIKFALMLTLMPTPLTLSGKTSEIKVIPTGPRLKAKQTI